MKINSIKLQNFRSHSFFETKFNDGINLLLGKNGAGKSSILEAIGMALFNANPRTTLNETIKIGEKFALINISFTANDGNIYRVERKIGQSASIKLYADNEIMPRFTAAIAINKLKELVGLETNSDVIYKNIITAEQNKLTEIFQLTETKRAEEYNKIFNTAIYRDMYKGYLSEVLKDYHDKLELAKNTIQIHSTNLKNTGELNNSILNVESELLKHRADEEIIVNSLKSLDKQKTEIEVKKNIITKLKNTISSNNIRLKDIDRMLEKLNEDLVSANNSLGIVKSNAEFYEQYQLLNNQLNQNADVISNLEKIETKKRTLENETVKKEKELNTISIKTEANCSSINLKQLELEKIINIIESENTEKNNIDLQLNEISYKIQIINKTKTDFNNLLSIRNKKNNEIESISKLIISKNEHLINEIEINNSITLNQNKLATFEEHKFSKLKLETEKEQLNERTKILIEAKEKLKGAICPYFNEKCKNIGDDFNSDAFFDVKSNEIAQEILSINNKLKLLKTIEKDIENCKNEINILNNKILNNKDLLLEIEKYRGNLNLLNEELNTNSSNIEIVNSNHNIPFDFDKNDLVKSYNNLITQFNDFNKLLTEKQTNHANIIKTVNELSQKKGELNREISKLQIDNENNSKKIAQLEISINVQKTDIISYQEQLKDLPNLKSQNENSRIEAEKIKPQFMLYTKNLENSFKADTITEEINTENKLKNTIEKEIDDLNLELKFSNEDEIETTFNNLIAKIYEKNENRLIITGIIATLEANNQKLVEVLKANLELEDKIKLLKKDVELYKAKWFLTNKFRENINSVGTIIAGRLLLEIARKASDNYQKISGKAEIIEWINNNTDIYQVYLIDNSSKARRKFELLSGGEQVSVAIAIRTALAQSLTSANFAIFDEPTVNLDIERKELLSRSLHTMLDNLKQVLIVTHDDTFREMSEAIEINKD